MPVSQVEARVRRATATASVRVTLLRVGRIAGRLRTELVADSSASATPGARPRSRRPRPGAPS